jgi:hypothetical protein
MTHESGGITTDAKTVQDIFKRIPSLVVLDGLDEVGSVTVRARIVKEIDKFVGVESPTRTHPGSSSPPGPAPANCPSHHPTCARS